MHTVRDLLRCPRRSGNPQGDVPVVAAERNPQNTQADPGSGVRDAGTRGGIRGAEHPWVNTPPERFVEYLGWLKANGYQCIAVRDLERYVDVDDAPAEPWSIIDRRRTSLNPP